MDYKNKYLKYKKKYLLLKDIFTQDQNIKKKYLLLKDIFTQDRNENINIKKKSNINNKISQKGGWLAISNIYNLVLIDWKINIYMVNTNDILKYQNSRGVTNKTIQFSILGKFFDINKYKSSLVILIDRNDDSFNNSIQVIIQNIDKFKNKYNAVYIIDLNPFKEYIVDACHQTDILRSTRPSSLRSNLSSEDFNVIFKDTMDINLQMAKIINELIFNNMRISNIELLGISRGGGIAINLLPLNINYKALYLSSPESPNHIMPLYNIDKDRLKNIRFIFGWNSNDNYPFEFVQKSKQEQGKYDEEITILQNDLKIKLNYKVNMFIPGTEHQLNSKLIDQIVMSDYLKNVEINYDKLILINKLLEELEVSSFEDLQLKIHDSVIKIPHIKLADCIGPIKWDNCYGECYSKIVEIINTEINSTAYMLRTLTDSLITINNETIQFNITSELTGKWEDDYKKIKIVEFESFTTSCRLIMGFGPSASGKTYWTDKIISLLSETDRTFPKTFITIDGGINRQSSFIYKAMVNEAPNLCLFGFANLFSPWSGYTLFNSNIVKDYLVKFLKVQTISLSLYVPESLGDCGGMFGGYCINKYNKYIEITGDTKWIGIYIWQHKNKSECKLDAYHKCIGCEESGSKREIKEGKKYSSSGYQYSENNGIPAMRSAPGGNYKIHNTGRVGGCSIFEDYTRYTQETLKIKNRLMSSGAEYNYDYKVGS